MGLTVIGDPVTAVAVREHAGRSLYRLRQLGHDRAGVGSGEGNFGGRARILCGVSFRQTCLARQFGFELPRIANRSPTCPNWLML
jgi:hypothetical protein